MKKTCENCGNGKCRVPYIKYWIKVAHEIYPESEDDSLDGDEGVCEKWIEEGGNENVI